MVFGIGRFEAKLGYELVRVMPNGLLVGALRARRSLKLLVFSAGGAGLLGACSDYSDTLLVVGRMKCMTVGVSRA
jgi:hypothetical protein